MLPLRHVIVIGLAVGGLACTPTQNLAKPANPPPIPRAAEGRFTVLVADFSGDRDQDGDKQGDTTQRFVTALETFAPLDSKMPLEAARELHPDVVRLHRFVEVQPAPSGIDQTYHRHEMAREWLTKTGAHLILWGQVTSGTDPRIELRITGSRDRSFGQAFPTSGEFYIPWAQIQVFRPFLFLSVAAETAGYEDLRGLGLQDELGAWIGKTEGERPSFPGDFDLLVAWALQARAARTGETALLDNATSLLQRDLERRSRSKDPVVWARLSAMQAHVLAEREALTANEELLAEVLRAYAEAAKELTQSRSPLDFGLIHNLRGKSYERLAEERREKSALCLAANAYWEAALVTLDGDVPGYMDTSLRGTQRSLSILTQGLPAGQIPECNPPLAEGLWFSYSARGKK